MIFLWHARAFTHKMPDQYTTDLKKIPPLGHAVIATLLLCVATVGYTYHMPEFSHFFTGENDFLPRYTQARMVGTGQMYSIEAGYREQDRVAGYHILGAYNDRMPWQALLMAPMCQLPYLWAYSIWIALLLVCFAVFVYIWLVPRDCVLWGATFLPLAASIIVGQDALLLTLCLAGVLRLAETRRDFVVGLLLALCTAKPHLFLLVPLALIAHRRWRIMSGAILGTVGLMIAGTAAAGWDWPVRWLAVASAVTQDTIATGLGVARRPSLFQFGMHEWTIGLALGLAVVFGFLIWRSCNLEVGIALAILGGILVAPHTALYDLPLLLVALPALPLPSYGRWLRIALFTPVPYWALLNGSPWSAVVPLMLLAAVGVSAWGPGRLKSAIHPAGNRHA
jgi:Glycosyltransferase family 87